MVGSSATRYVVFCTVKVLLTTLAVLPSEKEILAVRVWLPLASVLVSKGVAVLTVSPA